MPHVRWSDIELFHTNRNFYRERDGLRMGKVTYRAKVKLHGSCAAIQRLPDGSLEAMSREAVLSVEGPRALPAGPPQPEAIAAPESTDTTPERSTE